MHHKYTPFLILLVAALFCLSGCSDDPGTYTITFDSNDLGATGTMTNIRATEGETTVLPAALFTKTGWTFAGWATSPAGTVVHADAASFKMGGADMTLFAQWTPPAVFTLRDRGPAGGWVFYDKGFYSDDWRYLEAAISNLAPRPWGTMNWNLPGAESTYLGQGLQNTLDIINGDPLPGKAADACHVSAVTNGGIVYTNWHLPSLQELAKVQQNLHSGLDDKGTNYTRVGGFTDDKYWSSTERNPQTNCAFAIEFLDGNTWGPEKTNVLRIRAIRAF
jgi:uncharacterized repeat protein (TIGR02543 family)